MSYRKSEDTPAKKRQRLPFKVVIEDREEAFRAAYIDANVPVVKEQPQKAGIRLASLLN